MTSAARPPLRPESAAELRMASYLARVATGPELSKSLSRDEARDGMAMILAGEVDRAQAAVFLIALRMKRESHEELCGVLDALRAHAECAVAAVDTLVDMAEPYNGYLRHLPSAPFVPAVLAACGVACAIHGCLESGPKWGVTLRRILAACGSATELSPAEAASRVADAGWAYIDQETYCPPLSALGRLRTLIVKRPCLSLLEKLIAPIRARQSTHLWVGYSHRGYPEILMALADEFGYASMLAVRGVEGGVTTSLSGSVAAYRWARGEALAQVTISAREVVSESRPRVPALPASPGQAADQEDAKRETEPWAPEVGPETLDTWASAAAEAGRAALSGIANDTADMLVLAAASMLRHLGQVRTLAEGADRARGAIASGEALARFDALAR